VKCTDLAVSGANYSGGWAFAMCTGTTWSAVNTAGCVAKTCAAAGGYTAAINGERGIKACTAVSGNYASGNCYQTCTAGAFGAADCSQCVLKRGASICPASADGVWPLSFGGEIVQVTCSDLSKAYASGGTKATRRCDHSLTEDYVGVWSTIDLSACTLQQCSTDSGFAATNIGVTDSKECSVYSNNYKTVATSKAYRTCSLDYAADNGAWDSVDTGVSGDADICQWADCAAANSYTSAAHGADGEKTCATEDATNFGTLANTVMAKKTCGDAKTFGTANVDACLTGLGALSTPVKWCPADNVFGLTLSGTTVTVNCVDYDTDLYASGTLTRACGDSGWAAPTLTSCAKKTCPLDNSVSTDNPSGHSYAASTTQTGAAAVTVACATYDSAKYTDTDKNTSRTCTNVAGVATWGAVDVSLCTGFAQCTDGTFGNTNSGASSTTVTCAAAGLAEASVANLYSAGTVTKACTDAVWGTTDYSACTYSKCADDGSWTVAAGKAVGSEADEEVSIDCSTYNAKYTTGSTTKAKRVCLSATPTSKAVWSNVIDKSACVTVTSEDATKCAADAPWQEELSGATQQIQCSTYNPVYEATKTTTATRACASKAWANPDVSGCTLKSCAADDTTTTGHTWVQTDVKGYATLACATVNAALYASGTMYRYCDLNGSNVATWGSVDESNCVKVSCTANHWGTVASGASATKTCHEGRLTKRSQSDW